MSDGETDPNGRLVLIRHGETPWSRVGRHTSYTDLTLTERGEQQARDQGSMLRGHKFAMVLCSPRVRSKRTSALAGYAHPIVDDDLVEWDYGGYEGITTRQIVEQRDGVPWDLWHDGVVPGETPGETAEQVQARAQRVIDRSLPSLLEGDDVLLVSHGHFLRMLAVTWADLPITAGAVIRLDTGSVCELGFEHERQAVLRWNCPPDPRTDFS
ncbi:histidine phosphatase family protein [Humibacter ginsenosidimutans]|uniref:Histidine phosphatase family protein n=1 Tax=Humibacter ginsenosidimutans TaxID=2599293 RepID=A0A5B8M0G7_9MICO|nr:histidine phosphatase family protein [Humibacter ginsenosidimutans]QDZ14157.1 histidine phosphatase family protein [Humibacter ginsenosidimutans]